MMVVFFVGLGLSAIVCGFLDSPTALLVGLAAIGLFASIYHPVGIAWLVKNAESRGKALGINGICGSIGVASAGLTAGALIDSFGWRAAFIAPGVVSLGTGLVLMAILRLGLVTDGAERPAGDVPPSRGDMLRVFVILVATMLIMGIIFQATQAALPKVFDLRLRDIAGDGTFGIGAIVAGVYLVGGVMQVIGGHLADRYPLKPIYFSAFLLQVPILAGIAALSGLPLIGVAVLTVVLSTAALPAENMMLAHYAPRRHQSLAFGVKFVLAFATAPLALAVVAFVQERTGEFVWLFAALAGIAGIAALAAMMLPAQRQAAPLPAAAE